jgi:ribosomal protein S27AE
VFVAAAARKQQQARVAAKVFVSPHAERYMCGSS